MLDEKHPDEIGDGATATAERAQKLAEDLGATPSRSAITSPACRGATPRPCAPLGGSSRPDGPRRRPSPARSATRVTPGEERSDDLDAYDELDVVALDAPGLFSKVAGVIALNGGSIMGATAFTRDDGTAVDTFTVLKPDGAPLSWWARVEGDLVDAIAGKLALRARLATRARQEQRKLDRLPDVATKVSDRRGRVRAAPRSSRSTPRTASGCCSRSPTRWPNCTSTSWSRGSRRSGNEVVDAFTVRDATGKPLDDDHAAEVELATVAVDALEATEATSDAPRRGRTLDVGGRRDRMPPSVMRL